MELHQNSCVHGYHVIWNAVLGQVLLTEGELATQRGHDHQACRSSEFKETLRQDSKFRHDVACCSVTHGLHNFLRNN